MGGGDQPQYITQDYSESMEDALTAQVKLAPDLYRAEADEEFGRKAYARLDQEIIAESLFGKKRIVDSEGYVAEDTGYDPEKFTQYKTSKEATEAHVLNLVDGNTAHPLYHKIMHGRDGDGSRWDNADRQIAGGGIDEDEEQAQDEEG
mgnify:CR=1 FL=1